MVPQNRRRRSAAGPAQPLQNRSSPAWRCARAGRGDDDRMLFKIIFACWYAVPGLLTTGVATPIKYLVMPAGTKLFTTRRQKRMSAGRRPRPARAASRPRLRSLIISPSPPTHGGPAHRQWLSWDGPLALRTGPRAGWHRARGTRYTQRTYLNLAKFKLGTQAVLNLNLVSYLARYGRTMEAWYGPTYRTCRVRIRLHAKFNLRTYATY
eukprot:SAG31_NODE_970_length_10676_cov_12.566985_11_plen_209_part_00